MDIDTFISIENTEDSRKYFFISLAHALNTAGQMYSFGDPFYHNADLGLSIVARDVNQDTYYYLEKCVVSMGYQPIPEAGPVRVVMFESQKDKETFKLEFDSYFENAQSDLKKMGGVNPSDYYRMECKPSILRTFNDENSHSVELSIVVNSEISKNLWIEHLEEESDFPWEISGQFSNQDGYAQISIKFRRENVRNRYIHQLNQMIENFTYIQNSNKYKVPQPRNPHPNESRLKSPLPRQPQSERNSLSLSHFLSSSPPFIYPPPPDTGSTS